MKMENSETKITKNYINETLAQTKSAITKLFDTVDTVDRIFYGRRMKFFIWGCMLVLIVAPILDELIGVQKDWFTYFSTLLFLIFDIILLLAFVGAWRDDTGNWTWH